MAGSRPQTSRQAKAAYKKRAPGPSEDELKKFERIAERERRAESIKDREKKKRESVKRRHEQDQKDKEARRKMGMSLATQLAGYSHTQKQLRGAMESFVRRKDPELVDAQVSLAEHKIADLKQSITIDTGVALEPALVEDYEDIDDGIDDDLILAELDNLESVHTYRVDSVDQECTTTLPEGQLLYGVNRPSSVSYSLQQTPISRVTRPSAIPVTPNQDIDWYDFLESASQLDREICLNKCGLPPKRINMAGPTTAVHDSQVGSKSSLETRGLEENAEAQNINDPLNGVVSHITTADKVRTSTQPAASQTLFNAMVKHPKADYPTMEELGLSTQLMEEAFGGDDFLSDATPVTSPIFRTASRAESTDLRVPPLPAVSTSLRALNPPTEYVCESHVLKANSAEPVTRTKTGSEIASDISTSFGMDEIPWSQVGT